MTNGFRASFRVSVIGRRLYPSVVGKRHRGRSFSRLWAAFTLSVLATITNPCAEAEESSIAVVAARSAIVLRGTVVKMNASAEPMLAGSSSTAVVVVDKMYAGGEIAGDQKGKKVTVILHRPVGLTVGEQGLFFGNPRFVGQSLTIADEGEMSLKSAGGSVSTVIESAVQRRNEGPVVARLSVARLVFLGSVEVVKPLNVEGDRDKKTEPHSEHDPDWYAATVRVIKLLHGAAAAQVETVIFPASTDVVWFNSPKLRPGQEAIFVTHSPSKEESAQYPLLTDFFAKKPGQLVTEHADVLPATEESRVRGLLLSIEQKKQ